MGDAKKKSRSRQAILAAESRCIYCEGKPETFEHMPPRSMFRGKLRPSGLEFATCEACNGGTSGADVVASFFARLRPDDNGEQWHLTELDQLKASLERNAPGVAHELFRLNRARQILRPTAGGILVPATEVRADGPLLRGYLNTFSSKFGMALYREHVGEPLPLDGAVYSQWFLNSGLAQSTAEALLTIMPLGSTLSQGKFQVDDQFAYRFNCDNRSILAALAQFHNGLFVFVIATDSPDFYFKDVHLTSTSTLAKPGDLGRMKLSGGGPRYWH